VILAGGDVNLGRGVGQALLADPDYDPFSGVKTLLAAADLVLVNLESPLSHQAGETRHPRDPMVFTGPPSGADALAAASIDVVSVANNHAWDYGREGFSQTLDNLAALGIGAAGGSLSRGAQHRPVVVRAAGFSVAVFGATAVWNPGPFERHEARDHVAWADPDQLEAEIRRARAEHDIVLVAYHGGKEYSTAPSAEQVHFARRMTELGVDAVLGHHPHVPHGIAWYGAMPVFFSLGNFVFGTHRDHEWTGRSFVARLTFDRGRPLRVEGCPILVEKGTPTVVPEEDRALWSPVFRSYLLRASSGIRGGALVQDGSGGCFELARPQGPVAAPLNPRRGSEGPVGLRR
jgi:poly-gamma-glutamate synthesis protein (capsule biosynthesis protein)